MKIDLILIGNSGAGKTSLIQRFLNGNEENSKENNDAFTHTYTPTLGINLDKKDIKIKDQKVNLCIWDTAGQEKFFSLTKSYFQRADGVIVVFDITDEESFKQIEDYWLNQIKDKMDSDVRVILIGNKVDLFRDRNVKFVEAHTLATKYKIPYFEASAKTGECIEEAFHKIITICMESLEKQMEDNFQPITLKPETTNNLQKTKCFDSIHHFIGGFTKLFNKKSISKNDEIEQKKNFK